MKIEASAPSNIALIKYMGKSSATSNLPANPSLSYTLESLRTFVTLEPAAGKSDDWEMLPGFQPMELSDLGRSKFLEHFARLKVEFGIHGNYLIRSANNFPSDCGLASSASSYAALTKAAWELAVKTNAVSAREENPHNLSALSRAGSGSSCRSFFSPWAIWRGPGADQVDLGLRLNHAVVVIEDQKKTVSSSQAHQRIQSSLLFTQRPERATQRLEELLPALAHGHWESAFELCWNEFFDMHAMFETSRPSFGYIGHETLAILHSLRKEWEEREDGPLITLDAGPNVHLLYRQDQVELAERQLHGLKAIKSWAMG